MIRTVKGTRSRDDDSSYGESIPLPAGWAAASLQNLARPYREQIHPGDAPEAVFIGLEHVESGGTRRLLGTGHASQVTSAKAVFKKGDILFGKLRPYLRKVVSPDFDGICSTDFLVLRPTSAVVGEFLVRLLASAEFTAFTASKSGGVNLPRVKWSQMAFYQVALPPIAEQKRIIAKLIDLERQNQAVRDELRQIPERLQAARQSLFASAFSGKLTEKWRTTHSFTDTAADVISTAISQRQGKPFIPHTPEWETLIPKTWAWASLDQITKLVTSGSREWTRYYRNDGYGVFLLAQNIKPLKLDLSVVQRISPPDDRDKIRSQVQKDDIIVTIVGAGVGEVCRVPQDLPNHFVCQSVALVRPAITSMGRYLEYFFNAELGGQHQFQQMMYGQGRPHLSFDSLKSSAVPIAPLAEQTEIVHRLQEATESLERAMKANETALEGLRRLDDSLCSRAFHGELTDRLSSDKPASILLDGVESGPIIVKVKKTNQPLTRPEACIPPILEKVPPEGLTFDELLKLTEADYETLKDELFLLLSDSSPILRQKFDSSTRRMRFIRIAK